ncbi:MAG TPA: 2-C-methyl-D-erythritol 2,4-cyclodiphosphate synthase [Tepidisphaeraceae bacterium]|nr:2-C-methyl-D-erythritol 2,4-cyclodiphosphate synthase [Tepidisphaeraceae bacterium]
MSFRIGHGYDLHRLQPGGQLVLGGVVVSTEISPIAHSDGDVVIHAIVDALCGALGAGDIGDHFPDSNPAYRGAKSTMFLEKVKGDLDAAGYHVANLDVTILVERPRLKPFKAQIADNLGRIFGTSVNIKAGTNEGVDAIGRGEAIAAHALVLLAKNAVEP